MKFSYSTFGGPSLNSRSKSSIGLGRISILGFGKKPDRRFVSIVLPFPRASTESRFSVKATSGTTVDAVAPKIFSRASKNWKIQSILAKVHFILNNFAGNLSQTLEWGAIFQELLPL
nr:uncharacterized protein At5g50100, mitochondrial [Ipomoea batatas]